MRDIQLLADLAYVLVLALEVEGARTPGDFQVGHLSQAVGDLLGQAIGEVLGILAAREAGEGKDRHRLGGRAP